MTFEAVDRASYIIAITGGRDYTDQNVIAKALREQIDYAYKTGRRPILMTGGCPTGADEIARAWWHRAQRPYVVDPAEFVRRGRGAGPSRNGRMAIGATFGMDPPFHADVLLRFPGNRGTEDAEKKFRSMGVRVLEVV